MQVSERGVLAGLGLLWGWAIGVVGAAALGARVTQALTQVTAHALLVALGASVIVVLLGLRTTGTLLSALKDRQPQHARGGRGRDDRPGLAS